MDSYRRGDLSFDVTDTGPEDGRCVIALHGFPEDRHCWADVAARLAGAGYRVLCPDQRGYSPGARPGGRRAYALPELSLDVLALADSAGADRFDLIGHDWGAAVAWELAANHASRVRSLVALATPHPAAFREALTRSNQLLHSWYMLAFQLPAVPEMALRLVGPERGARQLQADGLDRSSAERYAARLCDPAVTGAINWYRALPFGGLTAVPPVPVPTLYVWGDGDRYLNRVAAERTAAHVTGPYRFEIFEGVSHWLPTAAAQRVAQVALDHLATA